MGGLKTSAALLACLLSLAGPGADPARATTLPDLPHVAACTGRLSALMEHQFLTDGPASEDTRRRRDAFADILDAITPQGGETRAMALRIQAKAAHRDLLTQAHFGPDPRGTAARRAETLIALCTGLLLG